ncbi:hypothetical protein GCM10023093_17460 [Nemorincola caseinilytica]|uniref:DUF6089 domain-containing protein n=1 Tax=Nemorincola caseinilytica TaxID=2054315 RepID=A0ABP8NGF2_9BACT
MLALLPLCLRAQETHHEIGLGLGVANYYGDLQPKLFSSSGYRPHATVVYKFFMNPRIGLRAGVSIGQVTAADSLGKVPINVKRNLSFTSNLFEFHGGVEFNFLPVDVLRHKVTPYVFGGIGVFYFNPFAEDAGGNKHFLRPLSTEGQGLPMYPDRKQYSLVNMSFPFGGGFKFFIGKTIFVTPEVGFRYTNTDYLDDVSKSYVNMDTLFKYKGSLARSMSFRGNAVNNWDENNPNYGYQRGDSKANDWYWFTNITVTVYFRSFGNRRPYTKTRCPGFYR